VIGRPWTQREANRSFISVACGLMLLGLNLSEGLTPLHVATSGLLAVVLVGLLWKAIKTKLDGAKYNG